MTPLRHIWTRLDPETGIQYPCFLSDAGAMRYVHEDAASPLGAQTIISRVYTLMAQASALARVAGETTLVEFLVAFKADFDTIHIPDHATLLQAAMELPEVKALVEAANDAFISQEQQRDAVQAALAALEAKP